MTTTDLEIVLDESLDFSVPCDYSACERLNGRVLEAEWIIVTLTTKCGCIPGGPKFYCNPCKELRLNPERGPVKCPLCGNIEPDRMSSIISAERL